MIFRQEVIGQFHCKSLLSLEIAKAEDIVAEPIITEYRSAQERAWTWLQMMYSCYCNTMETTIIRIFIRLEKRKCSHVERQGVWVHLKHVN